MENWKVALVSGAAGVGTAMFLKKKWTAGMILAGVGWPRLRRNIRKNSPKCAIGCPTSSSAATIFLESRPGWEIGWRKRRRARGTWYESLLSS